MLGAQLVDDGSTRSGLVAQRPASNPTLELGHQRGGEPVRENRERAIENEPGHLPVTGHRILARRTLAHSTERTVRRRIRAIAGEHTDPPETQPGKRWQADGDLSRDVAQRVAALVIVVRGVGQCADSKAVDDEHDGPAEGTVRG